MKNQLALILLLHICSCQQPYTDKDTLNGTWELIYAETNAGDSVTLKDLKTTRFIKIINEDHFSFFNQVSGTDSGFYSGAGTYWLDGTTYTEVLQFIGSPDWRDHTFDFQIEIKGDTLIQKGVEEIKQNDIKREIVEKYVRINL